MTGKESEKTTEAHLFKRMRQIGGVAHKYVCPSHRGKPDRVCEFPHGLVAFVEVKSEGKGPEPHQAREHNRMRARGQIVEVLDTKKEVDIFINLYERIDDELQLHKHVAECRENIRDSIAARSKVR